MIFTLRGLSVCHYMYITDIARVRQNTILLILSVSISQNIYLYIRNLMKIISSIVSRPLWQDAINLRAQLKHIILCVSVEGIGPKFLKASDLPPTQLLIVCWNCWRNMPLNILWTRWLSLNWHRSSMWWVARKKWRIFRLSSAKQ